MTSMGKTLGGRLPYLRPRKSSSTDTGSSAAPRSRSVAPGDTERERQRRNSPPGERWRVNTGTPPTQPTHGGEWGAP